MRELVLGYLEFVSLAYVPLSIIFVCFVMLGIYLGRIGRNGIKREEWRKLALISIAPFLYSILPLAKFLCENVKLRNSQCRDPAVFLTGNLPLLISIVILIWLLVARKKFIKASKWLKISRHLFIWAHFLLALPVLALIFMFILSAST